jgi:DNA-binding NarL/FixJ family response regulator
VLVCDDHVLVREGLRRLLEGQEGIDVIADAADGIACVEAAARLRPDVVLMDLVMPRVDGVEATRRILSALPDAKVVVLTSFADQARILDAIDAGAVGYLLKDAPADQVIGGIRAAARGDAFLDPRAARAVMTRHSARGPALEMTNREREVLSLLAAGLSNKVIARRLEIAEGTVKAHLTSIYRQIGVDSRSQAALWARERGL